MDLCRTTNWSFWHRTRNLYTAVHTRPFRSATHFRMDAAGHCGKKLPARCSGEETDFQQTESCPCMAKLLLSPVSGTITQIDRDQVERLRQEGLELVLDYPEGHEVSAMADGTDRIGHVIIKTDREAELDEQMKRVYRCIWIDGKNLETIWEEKTAK